MITELLSIHTQLTPEVAKTHSLLPQVKGDRTLAKSRVDHLRDALERGLFYSPVWAVAYCKETAKHYRINGKHSSHMLSEANGIFPKGLMATILQFQCDTVAELASLFDQFDSPASVRTRGDSVNVHKSLHSNLSDVSKTHVLKALAWLTYYIRSVIGETLSVEDQSQLVHQHHEFIAWSDPLAGTNRMKRSGVLAAMFATWQINAEQAFRFWTLVRDQSHEDVKSPTRVLGKFLEITQFKPIEAATKTKWDTRAFYVKSIHAWNAHFGNTNTDLKYHHSAPFPRIRAVQ